MPSAAASVRLELAPGDAAGRWLDVDGWSRWVPGLAAVDAVDPTWPAPGSAVRWHSTAGGRGHVSETVREWRPGELLALTVSDALADAEQRVVFTALPDGGCEIHLTVDFTRRARGPLSRLAGPVDWLFTRGAMADLLALTLERFAAVAPSGARPRP